VKRGLKEMGWDSVAWIHVVEDRAHWWDLVNTVMDLRFHKGRESFYQWSNYWFSKGDGAPQSYVI
jgi:hypothetical protein